MKKNERKIKFRGKNRNCRFWNILDQQISDFEISDFSIPTFFFFDPTFSQISKSQLFFWGEKKIGDDLSRSSCPNHSIVDIVGQNLDFEEKSYSSVLQSYFHKKLF